MTIDPSCPELSAKGKPIIIIGDGANSIGSEFAMSFAKAGAVTIAVIGRSDKILQETKSKVEAAYSDATVFVAVADVSRADSCKMLGKILCMRSIVVDIQRRLDFPERRMRET